jgi:hypothetical protein
MFSFLDVNIPIASNNAFSEVNVASAEQGNIAAFSTGVLQGNGSVVGQTTGDVIDIL